MNTKIFLVACLALAAIGLPNFASAGLPEAVAYLKSQTPDAWMTQALIAAGETDVPVSHLSSVAAGGFNPTNDYAKTILALAAAGKNPTTFGSIDYAAKLKTYYDGTQMGVATLLNDDIWSILAFASIKKADSLEATAAKNFLLANQNADGGWGYQVGGSSGSNDTAAAIMALIEAGVNVNSAVITNAAVFLHTLQNDDGGFMNDPAWGTTSDSGSDSWVISAIYKIGQEPTDWVKNGNNPLAHLQSLQDNTDGGFWWVDPTGSPEFNNKAMTAFAVIALAGESFPVGYYEIPEPIIIPDPEPTPAPAPSSSSGGSVIFVAPTACQSVEYDVWQNTCLDNWQYRNVLTVTPINCTLTVEQENQRKKTCVVSEGGADNSRPLITERKNSENTELKPEVLGVKIGDSSATQFSQIAVEAGDLAGGKVRNFVAEGTKSTAKLGAGERAGVLNSYKSSFGKSPQTQSEWEDVIRISNNQLPLAKSLEAEDKAKMEFKKVYQREADIKKSDDQTAINMMAYGPRPEKRDLNSERAGIRVFVKIYEYLPVSALDWDTIRAIAYGGIDI